MKPIYKLTAEVTFPEGVAPGMGNSSNRQMIAKNGKDEILLRGSALAGVLRHTYARAINKKTDDEDVCNWFGCPQEEDIGKEALVQVADLVLESQAVSERTHNLINRHTGAVVNKGLFSIEAVPPGSSGKLSITVNPNAGRPPSGERAPETLKNDTPEGLIMDDPKEFTTLLAGYITDGLLVGGNSNRGIGRMEVDGKLHLQTFAMDQLDGIATFLDAQYKERRDGITLEGQPLNLSTSADILVADLELGIPRGEDVLVGDGLEADYMLKPQSVVFADGEQYWRIPGSSLRGIFRGWMTRLAVKEILSLKEDDQEKPSPLDGKRILDSVERWDNCTSHPNTYNPDDIAWGFVDKENRQQFQEKPHELNDPILDLFGSLYQKSRIHISDAFSNQRVNKQAADRMHVAVDRFSGGAHEGALFQNQVLTGSDLKFSCKITIDRPREEEVAWLVKTLRALHLGILLVGSSKGAGRLEIKSLSVKGPMAGQFDVLLQEVN